ncbi:HHLA1 protein, partial [Arenaria interpres]|nr:HHLA1 protein [Arenaria interpres]
MQSLCWHVPAKMSLGFLCFFLVCNTAEGTEVVLPGEKDLFLHFTALCIRRENKKEKQVAVLATAELPAKSVDLAAINLTELVNGMLNTALRGTKKLFSLLSITSYSSFAFHKVSVTVYNISNVKNVDPGKFPMHYCYCLNNVTNDLTDFTALLVDIIGNSTSYLTEIFKSTSILSVRQSNDSDCIYICVMTGQTGRNLSDFWELLEKSPAVNYTFSSNSSSDLDSVFSSFMKLQDDPNKTVDPSPEHEWTFKNGIFWVYFRYCCPPVCYAPCCHGSPASIARWWCPPSVSPASPATRIPLALKGEEMPTMRFPPWPKTVGLKGSGFPSPHLDASRPRGTVGPPPTAGGSLVSSPALQPSPTAKMKRNGVPSFPSLNNYICSLCSIFDTQLIFRGACTPFPCVFHKLNGGHLKKQLRCPQAILKESRVTSPPVTLIVQKISPCVMELCRFFQLCLCVGQRRYSRKEAMRYCIEYYSWFLKNASYVCERVKRLAYSHTLKQKCLKNIC